MMLSPFSVKSTSMVTQQKYLSIIIFLYYPAEFQQLRRCHWQSLTFTMSGMYFDTPAASISF